MEQPVPSSDRRYTVAEHFQVEATSEQKFEFRRRHRSPIRRPMR